MLPPPPGVVSTAAELDRELIELYEFSVDVSDEGVPPRRSAAVVKVTAHVVPMSYLREPPTTRPTLALGSLQSISQTTVKQSHVPLNDTEPIAEPSR